MKVWSKSGVIGWIVTLLGLSSFVGMDLPVDQIETLLNRITDDVLALWMLISGPVIIWLRVVTSKPVVSGLLGWLGLKKKE